LTPPSKDGEKRVADFIIERDSQFPSVVQLMGIESPGLTSAPAIAEHVQDLVAEILD
jgi:glycerol-3-phosphate dehydrogenase